MTTIFLFNVLKIFPWSSYVIIITSKVSLTAVQDRGCRAGGGVCIWSRGMGPSRGTQRCHFRELAQQHCLELHTPFQRCPTRAADAPGAGADMVVTAARPPTHQQSSQAEPTPAVPPALGPNTFSFGALGIPWLGQPTLPSCFFMPLHAPVIRVCDFFLKQHLHAHQCSCSCCSLQLERLNTQPPSIET